MTRLGWAYVQASTGAARAQPARGTNSLQGTGTLLPELPGGRRGRRGTCVGWRVTGPAPSGLSSLVVTCGLFLLEMMPGPCSLEGTSGSGPV